jgi:hypothetical protein
LQGLPDSLPYAIRGDPDSRLARFLIPFTRVPTYPLHPFHHPITMKTGQQRAVNPAVRRVSQASDPPAILNVRRLQDGLAADADVVAGERRQ